MNAAPAKWIPELGPWIPATVAAARVLGARLDLAADLLGDAARQETPEPRTIHRMRVATRRAAAGLTIFADYLPADTFRRARRSLRRLRRSAGETRALDVHRAMIARARRSLPGARAACDYLLDLLSAERDATLNPVRACAERIDPQDLRRLRARLISDATYPLTPELRRARVGAAEETTPEPDASAMAPLFLHELAGATLPPLIRKARLSGQADLHVRENVHALRIAGKKLRYALEIFHGCLPAAERDAVSEHLEGFQERLGALNDAHEISLRIARLAESCPDELRLELTGPDGPQAHFESAALRGHEDFLSWWGREENRAWLDQLEALTESRCTPTNGSGGERFSGLSARVAPTHRRVAAIDVGTNSIRMVIAETDPSERYRVIKDVKETTRLGSGLYQSGKLRAGAIKRSLQALARMREVAEQHRVERVRAVATSAAREARNGAEFAELVHRRTGVTLDIIDADQEARYAYSSVVNAFDLDDQLAGIVDIGGGSTEIIFSRHGVIDGVHKLPLGAVRLTETFADSGDPSGVCFEELCSAIDRMLAEVIRHPRFQPEVLIGSGGTFTNLARLSIRRGASTGGAGRFPFDVRGHEVTAETVRELLDWLRGMPLDQRRQVPGLSAQRAEIIVAGFTIIERLMTHLRVPLLRVHDGGIRDGLLAQMIDELGFEASPLVRCQRQALEQVRNLARACDYEEAHSEHVAWLALRIFDQLAVQCPDAGGGWARPLHREWLEAAAILHDVGVLHGFPRHHKRSYEIIMHAHLPSFTHREVELIANIARYHRRKPPSLDQATFARLSDDDQRLVQRLAGILRVADGLDRLHVQNVRDVRVEIADDVARFTALADQAPTTNLRFALRKGDLFQQAFRLHLAFDWTAALSAAERNLAET